MPQDSLPRRSRPSQMSNDAALAVFQDIVGDQRQFDQLRRTRNPDKEGSGVKAGTEETEEENIEWAKLEQAARSQSPQDHQASQGRVLPINKLLYDELVRLVQMGSQKDKSIVEVFAFFETAVLPDMIEMGSRIPDVFRKTSEKIMYEVSTAKRRDFLDTRLPSVARITEIRRQLGLLSTPRTWLALVLELTEKILLTYESSLEGGPDDGQSAEAPLMERAESTEEADNSQATEDAILADQRQHLINELIDAWRVFILPDIVTSDPDTLASTSAQEFRMPKPDPILLEKYARNKMPEMAIASLFPRYAPQQLQNALPVVLATYAALIDSAIADAAAKEKAQEFITSVKGILDVLAIERRAIVRIFGEHKRLAKYMIDRWPLDGPRQDFKTNRAMRLKKDEWALNFKSIHGQLGSALRTRNLQSCEDAWERFWAAISSPDYQGSVRLSRAESLFDYFIMAFTTMRVPDRAIAVWNLMSTVGVEPTLHTWTSFMEGCKLASDPNGIHTIWEKLVASGIEIDTPAWTARISGLIRSGETEAGMLALKEMQSTWEAANAGNKKASDAHRPKAVKPTIEPVNAAIAGVMRLGDMQAARKILAWAGQHGIAPDVTTFNTILYPLMREGRAEEAGNLLEVMRKQGIEADEGTVTILLEASLGNGAMDGRSSEEQTELVKQVLAEIEAAGIDANQMTYGKIIYLLLADGIQSTEQRVAQRQNSPGAQDWGAIRLVAWNEQADQAVRVVLDRMRQRKVPLSPHIYTVLALHYFALDPPDVAAVISLIETGNPSAGLRDSNASDRPAEDAENPQQRGQRESSGELAAEKAADGAAGDIAEDAAEDAPPRAAFSPAVFDRVFWERVVRGFAQLGDTHSALKYFKNIEDSLSLTSSTLEDLLKALLKNNEWEAAAQLVAKVRAQKMHVVESATRGRAVDQGQAQRVFRHRFWHLAAQHGL